VDSPENAGRQRPSPGRCSTTISRSGRDRFLAAINHELFDDVEVFFHGKDVAGCTAYPCALAVLSAFRLYVIWKDFALDLFIAGGPLPRGKCRNGLPAPRRVDLLARSWLSGVWRQGLHPRNSATLGKTVKSYSEWVYVVVLVPALRRPDIPYRVTPQIIASQDDLVTRGFMRSLKYPVITVAMMLVLPLAYGQPAASDTDAQLAKALQTIQALADRLAAQELRIQQLEAERPGQGNAPSLSDRAMVASLTPIVPPAALPAIPANPPLPAEPPPAEAKPPVTAGPEVDSDPHDHMIQLPGGGPVLKLRGFFDFNFGLGTDANPLIFPLAQTNRSTFQAGEMDLFVSSKLSKNWSFILELVYGADITNVWSVDLERYQLTYRPSKYFEISGGRFHTAIGYYNTAFHHGNWFATATGRPFMYFFEDSGGLLPVHSVGVSTSGLVPGTESLQLHWIAEVSNGRSSSLDPTVQPVQNFSSDRTAKALNFATYIKPIWAPGLQMGGSFYENRLYPGGFRVYQHVSSAYAVYNNTGWEVMAESVLLQNQLLGARQFNTPLSYMQVSHKFGIYRPYLRYQYVHAPAGDPINLYSGRYTGPSVGVRADVTEYVALKLQYNRLFQAGLPAANGLASQIAFTF
jgi:hypothetical protein